MPELELKPCPFCGGEMKFHRDSFVNKYGQTVVHQYYLHADTEQDEEYHEILKLWNEQERGSKNESPYN